MNKRLKIALSKKIKNEKKIPKRESKINFEILTIEKVIEILKKNQDKSPLDISILRHYCLKKTKIKNKFINDKIEESSYDFILNLSLPNSYYKKIENENDVVINIGEPADYLYIILKGRVAVYEMQKINKEMSGYEYFLLLQNYKVNKENYILEKTIAENNLVFPIETEDIYNLDKIILKIFLNRQDKRILPNYLDLILEKAGLKYSDFKLESYIERIERRNKSFIEEINIENMTEEEKIEEYKKLMIYNIQEAWNVAFRNEKKILEELKSIDFEIMKKYMYLTKIKNEENISFYKAVFCKTIEDNDYFGESEHRIYTNKVISSSNNLELFCIKTDLYNEFVRKINSKILANQINFLLDNFYFRSIFKNYFEKYFFRFFELVKYNMKQIIVKENEQVQFCYFIKSGTVKLSSNRSILENHILIELIKNIIIKEGNSEYNVHSALNELYSEVKNNIQYLNNEINIKTNNHIMTLHEKNSLGSECYYYGLNYLYTAEANSEVVELYKIPIDKLLKIINDKNHRTFYYFKNHCDESLKILFNRLIKLNDMSLLSMKNNKIRKFGDIYNFENVANFEEKVNKNEKKLNNIVDKLNLYNSKIFYNNSEEENKSNIENENEKEIDNKNNINKNINSNFFLTQKPPAKFSKKLVSNSHINIRKKSDSIKYQNLLHNFQRRDIKIVNKNKSYNLFPTEEKDTKKDLTSYIKIFDYKENLQKQENREELRAKLGLARLARAERNEIEKLKKESRTYQNFYKLSMGESRSFLVPIELKKNDEVINKRKENEYKNDYSNNTDIIDLYQRNVFNKNKMLMTSKYKNNFSEYFDKKMGPFNFKYDVSKTLLVNKKKFEYSIFDKRYFNKNVRKNKSRSLSQINKKYTNLAELNKNNSLKNTQILKKIK